MTKEETISNLKAYLDGDTAIGNIIPLRLVLESAIKYLEPSLPTNFDEAVEKFAHFYDNGTCDGIAQDCFKAGAEWMAGRDKEKIEKAFFSGYNECEDRMKKEFERRAMAGEVNNTRYPTTIQLHTFDSSLKNGDKVNIIITKQEQD